jgi:hypothetical protein
MQVNSCNAELTEGFEFFRLRYTVLIRVLPDFDGVVENIGCIEFAICVTVEFTQGGKTICCFLATCKKGVGSKQFASRLDSAVLIPIQNKESIVAFYPASAGVQDIGSER